MYGFEPIVLQFLDRKRYAETTVTVDIDRSFIVLGQASNNMSNVSIMTIKEAAELHRALGRAIGFLR